MLGAGIAGLAFTLSLPDDVRVLLVTKGALGESNTRYAQGGLAAAVGPDDDPELHLQDTIAAGAGLVDVSAARAMVAAAPDAVEWLIAHGTRFDREGNTFALGREGAHGRNRVLHAGGDATGAEIERALVAALAARPNVTVREHTAATELRTGGGRCTGAVLVDADGATTAVGAAVTVLASGGAGRLWAVSSNPAGASGDGIALALAAGATLADLEFAQFHPTVLDLPGTEPFLVSEAVRGDGAWLRNDAGERFMLPIDPRAELAPRDVVARAIQQQHASGSRAWLDLRHLDAGLVRRRFPTIARHLAGLGLDLARDLIPVAPAAHYFMGGVAARPTGETSLPGLLAIGEVSCTGVHGANRLASNSLLEGLVFGRLAATAATAPEHPSSNPPTVAIPASPPPRDPKALAALRHRMQAAMRDDVSVVRSAASLTAALAVFDEILAHPALADDPSNAARATASMVATAREIARSALARAESRGGHYRSDAPAPDAALDGQHQLVRPAATTVPDRWFGSLDTALPGPVSAAT